LKQISPEAQVTFDGRQGSSTWTGVDHLRIAQFLACICAFLKDGGVRSLCCDEGEASSANRE